MITKRFFKTKDEVEVTFDISLPDEAEGGSGVCDATEWEAIPTRQVDGGWKARERLPVDRHGGQNTAADRERP